MTTAPHDHSTDDTLELVKELAWRRYAAARNYPTDSQFGKELVGEIAEYIWRAVVESNGNGNGNGTKATKNLIGLVIVAALSIPSTQLAEGNWLLAVIAGGAFALGMLAYKLIPWRRK